MKILIVGTGYVGLVTGACFAEMGHEVTCLDIDSKKIADLNAGIIPFFEPGLTELVKRNHEARRLLFSSEYAPAVKAASVCFIAVATPSQKDGSCDLSFVISAASEIAKHMDSYKVIVNKSTVPVGTATKVRLAIEHVLYTRHIELDFDVVSNPEFLREGSAVSDCMKPDRILLGVESERALDILKQIYSSFNLNRDRILIMDILSAELSKYAANAMLATRISFMNELAGLCELLGANINHVRIAIGSDHRIGYQYLYPGIGYGGSCLPKDIRALMATAEEHAYDVPLLEAVDQINQRQKKLLSKKITDYFTNLGGLEGKKIAIWGLSFKPDTDDIRDAPSLELIQDLISQGAFVHLYDPEAIQKAKALIDPSPQIHFCKDEYESAFEADAVVLVTEWKQFRFVNFEKIVSHMRGRAFFDGRNQYKIEEMHRRGFHYYAVGIPNKLPKTVLDKEMVLS